jgi:hypothetical protein
LTAHRRKMMIWKATTKRRATDGRKLTVAIWEGSGHGLIGYEEELQGMAES